MNEKKTAADWVFTRAKLYKTLILDRQSNSINVFFFFLFHFYFCEFTLKWIESTTYQFHLKIVFFFFPRNLITWFTFSFLFKKTKHWNKSTIIKWTRKTSGWASFDQRVGATTNKTTFNHTHRHTHTRRTAEHTQKSKMSSTNVIRFFFLLKNKMSYDTRNNLVGREFQLWSRENNPMKLKIVFFFDST